MTGRQRLALGNFLLSDGPEPVDSGRGYTVITLSEGLSFGEPTPIVTGIASLIEAGALVAINGWDNRTGTTFQVTIEGDSRALARAEKDLRAEMGSRRDGGINNVLTWEPPDGLGDPTAFDVLVSELKRSDNGVPNDFAETFHHTRTWLIELTCLPWARSVNKVKISSQFVIGGAEAVLNACDSTAGWSTAGFLGPYVVQTIGARTALKIGPNVGNGGTSYGYANSQAIRDLAGTDRYLVVDVKFEQSGDRLQVYRYPINVSKVYPVLIEQLPDGWQQHVYDTEHWAADSQQTTFSAVGYRPDQRQSFPFWMDNIRARDSLPSSDPKQTLNTFSNGGSEEAPMSLHVGRDAEVLGDTLVASWPDMGDGFTPGVAKFSYSIPQRALRPGPYEVIVQATLGDIGADGKVARGPVRFRTNGLAANEVLTRIGRGAISATYVSQGTVTLPPSPGPPESNHMVEVTYQGDGTLVDIFLVPVGEGGSALTIIPAAPRNVWIESASADLPRGAVYVGTADDKTDALAAGTKMTARGRHRMARDGTAVFVASAVSAPPLVEAEHYLTFHSHVILEDDDG